MTEAEDKITLFAIVEESTLVLPTETQLSNRM